MHDSEWKSNKFEIAHLKTEIAPKCGVPPKLGTTALDDDISQSDS